MALSHFLHQHDFPLVLAHINHGMRGVESDADEQLVQGWAQQHQIPFEVHRLTSAPKGNFQAWAREERYRFLRKVKSQHGCQYIATAHHRDDGIETALLNFLRGTGIFGLRGIPALEGDLIRPLLQVSRSEIDAYVKKHDIPYRDDASNATDDYTRNRLRHQIMPALVQHFENSEQRLHSSLKLIEQDAESMLALANKLYGNGPRFLLKQLPTDQEATALYHLLKDRGFNRTQVHDMVNASAGAICESQDWILTRSSQYLSALPRHEAPTYISLQIPGEHNIHGQKLVITETAFEASGMPTNNRVHWLDAAAVHPPLRCCTADPDDRFHPIGARYEVALSAFLKDLGFDRTERTRVLVIKDGKDQVIAIPGIRLSERVKCNESTKRVISVEIL